MARLMRGEKGQVLVLVALFILFILVGLGALAIDIGRAYGIRAKLNAASDAAAIAAGRAIGQGKNAVEKQARDVFNANFPDGLLGSSVTGVNADARANGDGSWTITVNASASLPTSFAPVLPSGLRTMPVNAAAVTTVRTLDMMLVLDNSGSLTSPAGTPALLRNAARRFVRRFDTVNDRVGLIRFASGTRLDVPITVTKGFNLTQLDNIIQTIDCDGNTASEDALRIAKDQLDGIPSGSRNSLRVIVFFTDGAPNTLAGNFIRGGTPILGNLYSQKDSMEFLGGTPAGSLHATNQLNNSIICNGLAWCDGINNLPNTDYTGTINLQSDLFPATRTLATSGGQILNTRCNVNMAARNMLENIANAARNEPENPIRIFTIGLGSMMTSHEVTNTDGSPGCGYGNNELGQNILRRLANIPGVDTYNGSQPSGIYAFASSASQLDAAFDQVASQLLRLSQ